MTPKTPEAKLRRGRTMLILGDGDEPFFGSIAVNLNLVENKACPSAATDGVDLIYNPDWIMSMHALEVMTLFEHEVYHVALKHGRLMRDLMQENDFDLHLFQIACDHVVNGRLVRKNRRMPLGPNGEMYVYDPKYDGMSALRIYRELMEEKVSI